MTIVPSDSRLGLVPRVRKHFRAFNLASLERRRARDMAEGRVALSAGPAQVSLELTARCNLECVTCRRYHIHEEASWVRGAMGEAQVTNVVGDSGYMSSGVFERSLDLVRDAYYVELAGYGEPMMHPNFHGFARALKERGHHVNSITNGLLLTEEHARRLVDARFDQISVSIDGLEHETLRVIRGVDRDELFANLERLHRIKQERGLRPDQPPRLNVNFVLARFNIREMPALVRRLAGLGLYSFYGQPLEAVAAPELLGRHLLYTDPAALEEARALIGETEAVCRELGVECEIRPLPSAAVGWEPEGVPIEDALAVFSGQAHDNPPRPREYRSVHEVEAERAAAFAKIGPQGAEQLDPLERAAPAHLSARHVRENRRCPDFFRYAFVTWGGKVLSCCFEQFGVGDLNLQTADEVWNGETYRELRRAYHEQGIRSVCAGCSKILD